MIVVNPLSPNNFADLCKSTGHPEWMEQFPLMVPERQENYIKLLFAIEDWAKDKTAVEVEEIISAGGCPVARVRSITEALEEPQAKFRQSMVTISDGAGAFTVANSPLRMVDSESRIRDYAPDVGEHNEEILTGLLGLSKGELAKLVEDRVVQGDRSAT